MKLRQSYKLIDEKLWKTLLIDVAQWSVIILAAIAYNIIIGSVLAGPMSDWESLAMFQGGDLSAQNLQTGFLIIALSYAALIVLLTSLGRTIVWSVLTSKPKQPKLKSYWKMTGLRSMYHLLILFLTIMLVQLVDRFMGYAFIFRLIYLILLLWLSFAMMYSYIAIKKNPKVFASIKKGLSSAVRKNSLITMVQVVFIGALLAVASYILIFLPDILERLFAALMLLIYLAWIRRYTLETSKKVKA